MDPTLTALVWVIGFCYAMVPVAILIQLLKAVEILKRIESHLEESSDGDVTISSSG
jgi:hypothetical protein